MNPTLILVIIMNALLLLVIVFFIQIQTDQKTLLKEFEEQGCSAWIKNYQACVNTRSNIDISNLSFPQNFTGG